MKHSFVFAVLMCAVSLMGQISVNNGASGTSLTVVHKEKVASIESAKNAAAQKAPADKMYPSEEMPLSDAVKILEKTPLLTSAKFGKYATNQSRAFAVIVHCQDAKAQSDAIRQIYKNAQYIEGKLYALAALKATGDADAFNVLKSGFNPSDDVRVLVGRMLRKLDVEKVLNSFENSMSFYLLRYVPIASVSIE